MRKTARRLLVTVCAISVSLLIAAAAWSWYWLYRDTTIYAPGYTEEKFSQVEIGMNSEEVYALLGPPLSIDSRAVLEMWLYDDSAAKLDAGTAVGSTNVVVAFDASGRVVDSDFFYKIGPGMTKDQVRKLLGEPLQITPARSVVLSYSRPGGEVVFRARVIELSAAGRVSRIVQYQFHD
jgi:outer membrane protein assembly factor BamE (lipoprotein component of BamABCDE complex)